MTIKDAFSLASLNIFKNPLRSILTVLGLAIGVGAIVTVLTLSKAGEARVETEIARMGVNKIWITNAFGSRRQLQPGDGETISAATQLNACERVYQTAVAAAGDEAALAVVTGCDENMPKVHQVVMKEGRFLSSNDEKNMRDVAVLDESMAAALGLNDPVGQSVSILGRYYTVIGLMANQAAQAVQAQGGIYIPLSVFRACIGERTDEISLSVSKRDQAQATAAMALSVLPKQGDYEAITLQEEIEAARAVISIFVSVLAAVAAICMLVGGIGVMNILLVSVNERRREIGVIKAIGGTDSQVMWLFLVEAASYALLGAMIGILSGQGMIGLAKNFIGMEATLEFSTALLTAIAAVGIGLFFGAAPAWKASKLLPVAALKQD